MQLFRTRGQARFDGHLGFITVHRSYLLRIPAEDDRRRAHADFVADLRQIRSLSERDGAARAAAG